MAIPTVMQQAARPRHQQLLGRERTTSLMVSRLESSSVRLGPLPTSAGPPSSMLSIAPR